MARTLTKTERKQARREAWTMEMRDRMMLAWIETPEGQAEMIEAQRWEIEDLEMRALMGAPWDGR